MKATKRKTIGYFEGTDPIWLTTLTVEGCDTLPVSNGYDGHGKNVRLFSAQNKVDAVIGYLHKVVAPPGWEASTEDILHACLTYEIPVLLAVPSKLHAQAKKLLGRTGKRVRFTDPAQMLNALQEILQ